ncbi:hypothetical protein CLOSYM_03731, partial [[Clostridium] symbiosum ATCC 14940]
QARKSLWIETMKLCLISYPKYGQARKSLWIETPFKQLRYRVEFGQARKSLWIETLCGVPIPRNQQWSGS